MKSGTGISPIRPNFSAWLPEGAKIWLDVGSGGGLPGLGPGHSAGSSAREQKSRWSRAIPRKAAFLGEVARKTGVPVEIYSERIEKPATQAKPLQRDVITARVLCSSTQASRTHCPVFFSAHDRRFSRRAKRVEAEVSEARKTWDFDCSLVPSLTDADGVDCRDPEFACEDGGMTS